MAQIKIPEIDVNLWNKYTVRFKPHPDVNIIVGINGSGKTTLLSGIEKTLSKRAGNANSHIYVPSIDNLSPRDKRKKESALTQDLNYYIYDLKDGPSLFYYRVSALDASKDYKAMVDKRVRTFCDSVNEFFKDSGKTITLENNKFFINSVDGKLAPDDLSSGEKQILLLMLRIFLLDEKESVVLIDEPESSLDISWQYKLIGLLVRLNPNAQFFITTHSPSIFGDGWGDRIFYMEDITVNIEESV